MKMNGMKQMAVVNASLLALSCGFSYGQPKEEKQNYNVLFIAIDDLNDWTGPFGGHPQGLTPNINRLASEGVIFSNTHCAASVCNPSRAALMSGFRPSTTGIYGNPDYMYSSPVLEHCYMLPEWLSIHGYYTISSGKVYHQPDLANHTWDEWANPGGSYGNPPGIKPDGYNWNGLPADEAKNMEWGGTTNAKEVTPGYVRAEWAADILENRDFIKPFFLAVGIFRPHLPWLVPQEYFDKFPLETIQLPIVKEDDLNDIPGFSPSNDYQLIKQYNKEKEAVQAYLAAMNYADDCVGVMLDALENSSYKDNTIVILWGDHGWHLGEKLRYKKFTLWEEATRMPFIIKVPGVTPPGSYCHVPVNLMDVYPTITDLLGLPPNTNNEGKSLVPFLSSPFQPPQGFSWTTMGEEKHTIRSDDWRYIQRDGTPEELYDHKNDPMEHDNLKGVGAYSPVLNEYRHLLDSIMFRTGEQRKPLKKHIIPGIIQAEHFDRGGSESAYHDEDPFNLGFTGSTIYYREKEGVDLYPCSDPGGGFHVGRIMDGEWLRYTIDTIEPGRYTLNVRISSGGANDKQLKFTLDGEPLADVDIPETGSPDTWQDVSITDLELNGASKADLHMEASFGNFNVNYFEFVKSGNVSISQRAKEPGPVIMYHSPVNGRIYINVSEVDDDISVGLFNLNGQCLYRKDQVYDETEIPVSPEWSRGIYVVQVCGKNKVYAEKVVL